MACRAFTAINVDTSDLGNVPDLLRSILEATLSQEASSESLEKYLPRIRDIIINLLHGLKRKQQRLRQRQGRDRDSQVPQERSASSGTLNSNGSGGLSNILGDRPESSAQAQETRRPESTVNQSPTRRPVQSQQPPKVTPHAEKSIVQNAPTLPYPAEEMAIPASSSGSSLLDIDPNSFPTPPPDPQQASALAALQKGGDLERRASRRYSQYQISKHLGSSGTGLPILPPQNGPIPNRGRKEARESLRAVQKRESVRHSRTGSNTLGGSSPIRFTEPDTETVEEQEEQPELPTLEARSPEEKYAPGATVSGPVGDQMYAQEPKTPSAKHELATQTPETKPGEFYQVSPPPTPTKDLTLFLQYKSKVKKIVLPEGRGELSIGRLQLAFIEKFSWNTQQNGTDLPEIYIQDPVSGIRHELEDLSDVKDRTVLVLNVEALDEVKKHFDDGIAGLTTMVRDMKQNFDDQAATLQRVSDRQQQTANEMARLATASPVTVAPASDGAKAVSSGPRIAAGHLTEIQSLRRDLAVVRQTYSNFQNEIQKSMSGIRTKAAAVKTAASKAVAPETDGDAGYTYVTNGRKKLNADSDRLVAKVDDLQDLVEDLRKDIAQRGVRPLPRQIQSVTKDIEDLNAELKRMEEYMSHEKPIWTKIWEKELEDVCQGRDELRLMEDLLVDLRDDLEKAAETFTLVDQASKEQVKDAGGRSFSAKGLSNLGNSLDQSAAKEDMLGEVRALQPNHEDRLEAIERAEKLRQKELLNRKGNAMQREIEEFVGEGKLKKSGGFEEVERARVAMDDKIRKEVWDRMNGLLPEDEDDEEEDDDEEGDEEEEEEFEEASEHPSDEHH